MCAMVIFCASNKEKTFVKLLTSLDMPYLIWLLSIETHIGLLAETLFT